mgnify:CR=1 FL=1
MGKTQAEVKEKLAKAIADSQQLDVTKTGNYTVATWIKTWYEVYAEPRLRPDLNGGQFLQLDVANARDDVVVDVVQVVILGLGAEPGFRGKCMNKNAPINLITN